MIAALFHSLPEKKSLTKPLFVRHTPHEKIEHYDKGTQQTHLVIGAAGYDSDKQERYAASLL